MNLKAKTKVVDNKVYAELEEETSISRNRQTWFNVIFQGIIFLGTIATLLYSGTIKDTDSPWCNAGPISLTIIVIVGQLIILKYSSHTALFVFLRLIQLVFIYGVKALTLNQADCSKTLPAQITFSIVSGVIMADFAINRPGKTKKGQLYCNLLLAFSLVFVLILDAVFVQDQWSGYNHTIALIELPVASLILIVLILIIICCGKKKRGFEIEFSLLGLITLTNLLVPINYLPIQPGGSDWNNFNRCHSVHFYNCSNHDIGTESN
ncbi:uncharacterized protein LOC143466137 [Clavelina lepadiformis]|uniref:uncharacterized protein LOC143466137 n=1 Tax=Clavelina lepadiformis TaxID=159417 RepID=UPI004041DCF5